MAGAYHHASPPSLTPSPEGRDETQHNITTIEGLVQQHDYPSVLYGGADSYNYGAIRFTQDYCIHVPHALHIFLSLFWIMYYWTLSTYMRQWGRQAKAQQTSQLHPGQFFFRTHDTAVWASALPTELPWQLSWWRVQIYTIQPKANLKGNVSVHI